MHLVAEEMRLSIQSRALLLIVGLAYLCQTACGQDIMPAPTLDDERIPRPLENNLEAPLGIDHSSFPTVHVGEVATKKLHQAEHGLDDDTATADRPGDDARPEQLIGSEVQLARTAEDISDELILAQVSDPDAIDPSLGDVAKDDRQLNDVAVKDEEIQDLPTEEEEEIIRQQTSVIPDDPDHHKATAASDDINDYVTAPKASQIHAEKLALSSDGVEGTGRETRDAAKNEGTVEESTGRRPLDSREGDKKVTDAAIPFGRVEESELVKEAAVEFNQRPSEHTPVIEVSTSGQVMDNYPIETAVGNETDSGAKNIENDPSVDLGNGAEIEPKEHLEETKLEQTVNSLPNQIESNSDEKGTPLSCGDGVCPQPYCGVWGMYRVERRSYADLQVLSLLYEDLLRLDEAGASEYLESLASSSSAKLDSTLDEDLTGKERNAEKQGADSNGNSSNKRSVNTQFVEGLDDIHKLFEGVDPLDVGAAGSSMQEVLMGQGTRIVIKRVSMAFRAVRNGFVQTRDKLMARLNSDDHGFRAVRNGFVQTKDKFMAGLNSDDHGVKINFKREDAIHALEVVWSSATNAFRAIEGIIEDLFEGEQEELADDELRELASQMKHSSGREMQKQESDDR
jgi:hypothetical protein